MKRAAYLPLLCLLALGCEQEPMEPIVIEDADFKVERDSGAAVLATVNGHWDRTVPIGPNEGRQQKVSFAAKQLADWTASGSIPNSSATRRWCSVTLATVVGSPRKCRIRPSRSSAVTGVRNARNAGS